MIYSSLYWHYLIVWKIVNFVVSQEQKTADFSAAVYPNERTIPYAIYSEVKIESKHSPAVII